RRAQRVLRDVGARRSTVVACVVLAGIFAAQQVWGGRNRAVSNDASLTVLRYIRAAGDTARGIAELQAAGAEDPFREIPVPRLRGGPGGADVLRLFVESYGRSALEMPRYAATTGPALAAFGEQLAEHGLSSVSGWLTSPTVGGQSWLASGTFTS